MISDTCRTDAARDALQTSLRVLVPGHRASACSKGYVRHDVPCPLAALALNHDALAVFTFESACTTYYWRDGTMHRQSMAD